MEQAGVSLDLDDHAVEQRHESSRACVGTTGDRARMHEYSNLAAQAGDSHHSRNRLACERFPVGVAHGQQGRRERVDRQAKGGSQRRRQAITGGGL